MTCAPDRGVCAQPTTIRLEALFLLLIDTGLRPGEALALGWSDLDLDASWLRVERGLGRRRMGEPWRFEAPKTSGSRRTVPLPATIIRALRAHRAGQVQPATVRPLRPPPLGGD